MRTLAEGGNVSWQRDFDVYFDYYGSRVLGADYANVSYDTKSVSFRIPSHAIDRTLELYHGDKLIYTAPLDFCNKDGTCGISETHASCPLDCPLDRNDAVCTPAGDGTCDPDCRAGIDPDCSTPVAPSLLLVAGIAALLVIAAVAGVYVLRKRKQKAE